jgi:hypothetical protein
MKNIQSTLLIALLALFLGKVHGQSSNEAYIEYLPSQQGVSLRTGYEFGFKMKDLKSRMFNSRMLFIRNGLGLLEMDKQHTHLSLNSLIGFRFYNQKTGISFEPLNLGLGYSYTRFKSIAFENINGSFHQQKIFYHNHFISTHLQAFAIGYAIPVKSVTLKIRLAPEAIAYFSTQMTGGSDFDITSRVPLFKFCFPISLNINL